MNEKDREHLFISRLIRKELLGRLSSTEQKELDDWKHQSSRNLRLYQGTRSTALQPKSYRDWINIDVEAAMERHRPDVPEQRSSRFRTWGWTYYAAAAVLAMVFLWLTPNFMSRDNKELSESTSPSDFSPAESRALIKLSDGREFNLDQSRNVVIFENEAITYENGEPLAGIEAATLATITTPRGGTYDVILPDGTHVKLNAATTLEYPLEFQDQIRKVRLHGEAYFDVAPSQRRFEVETDLIRLQVLGTTFNLNAYTADEHATATLIEGSVQVTENDPSLTPSWVTLKPGEQGIGQANRGLAVQTADVERELSWVRGRFDFDGKNLHQVVREISRWYDVDVKFEGDLPEIEFFGGTYRSSNLSTILSILENSQIHYRFEGERTLILWKTKT